MIGQLLVLFPLFGVGAWICLHIVGVVTAYRIDLINSPLKYFSLENIRGILALQLVSALLSFGSITILTNIKPGDPISEYLAYMALLLTAYAAGLLLAWLAIMKQYTFSEREY